MADWHGRGGISEFVQAALNGLAMAVKELGDIADAAVSDFERLGGGVKATLPFVEGREGEEHGPLDSSGVRRKHGGILPKEREFLFQNA
jgi:hypothetical protein